MHKSTDCHDCVGGALVLMRVDYLIFGAYCMEINTFILSDVSSEGIYAVSSCLKTSCCLQNLPLISLLPLDYKTTSKVHPSFYM